MVMPGNHGDLPQVIVRQNLGPGFAVVVAPVQTLIFPQGGDIHPARLVRVRLDIKNPVIGAVVPVIAPRRGLHLGVADIGPGIAPVRGTPQAVLPSGINHLPIQGVHRRESASIAIKNHRPGGPIVRAPVHIPLCGNIQGAVVHRAGSV